MAKELPPLLKQYDRLAAIGVLAILVISLCYLVFAGVNHQKKVSDYDTDLEDLAPKNAKITAVDLTKADALLEDVANPSKARLLLPVANAADAANLCTAERRVLCVVCMKPIPFNATKCPICGGAQPEEAKAVVIDRSKVDSDDDGMPDLWEEKYKLNSQDAKDADLDSDNDGFTNLEEFLAGTSPIDAKDHPDYAQRMKLKDITGTRLPLRAINKMKLPATKAADGTTVNHYRVTFVPVKFASADAKGEQENITMGVREGEVIERKTPPVYNSGFKFVRYNEVPDKKIVIGEGARKRTLFANVSTIDLIRVSDSKPVTVTIFDKNNGDWPGEPLLEQLATIDIDVPGVTSPVVVGVGATFDVKGETFAIKKVDKSTNTVLIENISTKKKFELK